MRPGCVKSCVPACWAPPLFHYAVSLSILSPVDCAAIWHHSHSRTSWFLPDCHLLLPGPSERKKVNDFNLVTNANKQSGASWSLRKLWGRILSILPPPRYLVTHHLSYVRPRVHKSPNTLMHECLWANGCQSNLWMKSSVRGLGTRLGLRYSLLWWAGPHTVLV